MIKSVQMPGYTHADLSLVRTFEAVATLKSFSKASRLIGTSQSTVSEHIRQLEEKVGRTLITRTTRHMSLTPDGEIMHIYARSLLQMSENIMRRFGQPAVERPVRIGLSEDLADRRLTALLRHFMTDFPDFALSISTGPTPVLLQRLGAQNLDVVVGKRRERQAGGRMLWRNPTTWVAHGTPSIPPDKPVPLLLIDAPSILRSIALEALGEQGRPYRILFEGNSLTGLRAAFEAGLGIAVGMSDYLPDFVTSFAGDGTLPALPAVEVFIDHQPERLSSTVEAFAVFIEDTLLRLRTG